jgi:transposase
VIRPGNTEDLGEAVPQAIRRSRFLERMVGSAACYAAIEPGTDNNFVLILLDANTAGKQVSLDAFAATIAKNEYAAFVVDGAGPHRSKPLNVRSNITLVTIPLYCPELNPVEFVWLYLKEHFLSLRLHNDYSDIVAAASKAWKRLCKEIGRLTSGLDLHQGGFPLPSDK